MGQLVAELEALGYLERRPDPSDGRAKLVVLTQRGWDAIAVARAALARIEEEWTRALGPERAEAFRAALGQLAELSRRSR